MNSMAAAMGCRSPFTVAQWQELEHQALIFKYLIAGVPVPPELLIPIRRSFEALSGRYYHHPAIGYCYYGKKLDPEPGRCRRTDGKKWRCSKEAYPESKYCERHMHRGRNRSRKPVESQAVSQSKSSSSTITSLTPTGSGTSNGAGGSLQSIPLHSLGGRSNVQSSCNLGGGGSSSSQLPLDPDTFGSRYFSGSKPEVDEHSFFSGSKPEVDEHSFFSEASGGARGLAMDFSADSSLRLMPYRVSSFPMSKAREPSLLESAYPQFQSAQDLGQVTISSMSRQQQQQQHQYSFFGSEFGSVTEPAKHEGNALRPFCDEWPKTRDFWSDLEEDRSNRTSFSTTQLSISIPMASSDFSTTSSRSPNGGDD